RASEWLASASGTAVRPYPDRPEERDAHGAGNTVADRIRGGQPPDRGTQLRDPWIPSVTQMSRLARVPYRHGDGSESHAQHEGAKNRAPLFHRRSSALARQSIPTTAGSAAAATPPQPGAAAAQAPLVDRYDEALRHD